MFNTEIFEQQLATSWLGRSIHYFEELPSTNSYAKKMDYETTQHGTLILADYQSGGRGQYDRKWQVEPGQNLTFSLIFEPQKADRFTLLTLACAYSVLAVIKQQTGIETSLKWPNDILYDGKKLCGILTETQFSGSNLERVIVGIGINVNQCKFEDELLEKATSLSLISKKEFNREKLLSAIIHKTEYCYRLWSQQSSELVRKINKAMIGYGKWTHLLVNNEELEGKYKFLGINESGALIALNKNFDIHTFSYEQVRVRY